MLRRVQFTRVWSVGIRLPALCHDSGAVVAAYVFCSCLGRLLKLRCVAVVLGRFEEPGFFGQVVHRGSAVDKVTLNLCPVFTRVITILECVCASRLLHNRRLLVLEA